MKGRIALDRRIFDWEWWHDKNVSRLWITILMLANWEDKQWQGQTIKRGSFATSYSSLASITGLSVQEIRTCLRKLESTGEITRKSTNRFQIISVEKYDVYQSMSSRSNKQSNTPRNIQSTGNQQQLNNNNNLIKKNIYSEFGFSEDLQKALHEFEEMRKTIKAPMTDKAKALLAAKLVKMADDDSVRIAIVEQSIERGWKSVYELKDSGTVRRQDQTAAIRNRISELEKDLEGIRDQLQTDPRNSELRWQKGQIEDEISKLRKRVPA